MADSINEQTEQRRDRKGTSERIVDSAMALIVREGFQTLGINAVAREAGVDKVLIYRYFGGLEGLIQVVGQRLDIWLGASGTAPVQEWESHADFSRAMLSGYLDVLRHGQGLRRMLAWELVSDSPVIRRLGEARSEAVRTWYKRVGALAPKPPEGTDAEALNAVLIAAVHHLALREGTAGEFAGMDLHSPDSWKRILKLLEQIIHCHLGPSDRPQSPAPTEGIDAKPGQSPKLKRAKPNP